MHHRPEKDDISISRLTQSESIQAFLKYAKILKERVVRNRWADKQLKNWETAFLSLESGWNQYNQATKGLADALASGIPLSSLEATYPLNWKKVWETIASKNFWGPRSYQLLEWLSQGQKIQQRLLQLEFLEAEYRLHIHHSAQKVTDFWLGYDEGKIRYRTPYSEAPLIVGQPNPYQKGELLGWHYAVTKKQIQERIECCSTANCELFTWG